MPRGRYNNQGGTITDNPLTAGATTVNSAAFASLPAISKPNYLPIVLEPGTANEEIVYVMAHGQEAPFQGPEVPVTSTTASTLTVGHTYEVACTYVTAAGETTASGPSSPLTTSTGNASITAKMGNANFPVPSGVTSVKFYIVWDNGATSGAQCGFVGSATPSGGVATLVISASGNGTMPPTTNATAASTACTIWRGLEGRSGTGVSHATGSAWICGPTARDHDRANSVGFTPEGWDDAIVWGLYSSGTAPFTLVGLGSSILQGGPNTANTLKQGYLWQIAQTLTTRYGWYGYFFTPSYSAAWMTGYGSNGDTAPPFVFSTPLNAWVNVGPMKCAQVNNANPNFTFNSPVACQSMELIIWDTTGLSGSSFSYNVDGAATQTYNYTGGEKMVRISTGLTGLSNAVHAINFTAQSLASGAGTLSLIGVCIYPGTALGGSSGVGVAFCGWSGLPLGGWWRQDGTHPSDKISLWSGPTVTGAPPYSALGFGFPFGPVTPNSSGCWMILDQPNDAIAPGDQQTIPATPSFVETSLGADMSLDTVRRVIEAWRAANNDMAALTFHLPNGPDDVNSDVTSSLTGYNGSPYMANLLAIAATLKVQIENTSYDWGERAASLNFALAANPHPTPAGMQRIANLMLARLP